jgi:hypothetical protein
MPQVQERIHHPASVAENHPQPEYEITPLTKRRGCKIIAPKPIDKRSYEAEKLERPQVMTIGIGVLCSEKRKPAQPRPDHLILVADTMGSTDTDSTADLHKMFVNDELRVYATCAGTVERAADLFPVIEHHFAQLENRTHGQILKAINLAVYQHRTEHFVYDVFHTWIPANMPPPVEVQHHMTEEWRKYNMGAEMVVGTFDSEGKALLYLIQQWEVGHVHPFAFPGHVSIGSGAVNAEFWLRYRRQVLGMSVRQSIYHAFEAKKMAAKSPTVNESIEILIASHVGSHIVSTDNPWTNGCVTSIGELEEMFRVHGPQSTDGLGHPKP